MATQTGFVALNRDGRYAREYEARTLGGDQHLIEWVDDLNRATVFANKLATFKRHHELADVAIVGATATRVVEITGGYEA